MVNYLAVMWEQLKVARLVAKKDHLTTDWKVERMALEWVDLMVQSLELRTGSPKVGTWLGTWLCTWLAGWLHTWLQSRLRRW